MNPNLASSLGFAAAAAATLLAITPQRARADDITIDNTPFVSATSRANVRADYIKHRNENANPEWASQQNEATRIKSSQTPAEARAGYVQSRDEVRQLTAEDSGSSYLKRSGQRNPASVMGASSR